MLKLTRWCIAHRRVVVIGWIVLALGTTALASAIGRQYATNFTLPGTEAQRALDLLTREFPAQSGDRDTIVWHTAQSTVDSPSSLSARHESASPSPSRTAPVTARGTSIPHRNVVPSSGSRTSSAMRSMRAIS